MMRVVPLALLLALAAGCVRDEPAEPPKLAILGDVVVEEVALIPATYGEGTPAAPLGLVTAAARASAPEGSALSVELAAADAKLRLSNHAEWVRTSLRWEDEGCIVTMRSAHGETTLPGGLLSLDNAIGAAYPYQDYAFSGTCSGRLFLVWQG